MTSVENPLLARISVNPAVRFRKACIRGHRIAVEEVLQWLSSGASQEQILADYHQLEAEDFLAIYAYAAELGGLTGERPLDEAFVRRGPFAVGAV
jgi:uncharacterized protein (DUF433 family)